MNFSKKNHNLVDQNEKTVKKPQKHDANLQKNSTLYFQVGLILTLLATYGLLEMEFQTKILPEQTYIIDEPPLTMTAVLIAEEQKPIQEKVKPQKRRLIIKEPIIVKDDVVIPKPSEIFDTEPPSVPNAPVVNPDTFKDPKEPKPFVPDNPLGVELVPIYPGCEGLSSNAERLDCMSSKLNKLVGRKFNSDIVADLGLSKDQRIYVNFKINKVGNITEIRARNPHSKLKKEAIKVAKKIPQMQPAKQSNKNVDVMYTLPIMIKVKND